MTVSDPLDSNPLLITSGLPAFDRITPAHVEPGVREMLRRAGEILDRVEASQPRTWDELMQPMQQIDLLFEYGWSPVNHLMGVANCQELRDAHEAVQDDVVAFSLRIGQSKPLYEAFCGLRGGDDWQSFSGARQRIISKAIQSAELSGIGLEGDQRERFNEIATQLSQLGTEFANHVLDATKAFSLDITDTADAEGLPLSLRRLAAGAWCEAQAEQGGDAPEPDVDNGPWRITLAMPLFSPFMEHCRNSKLREVAYRAHVTRASSGELDNGPLIDRILRLRREKAGLLGFANFAEISLSQKMAARVSAVQEMFDQLFQSSWNGGVQDLKEVTEFANSNGHEGELRHWDVAFWAERLREDRYAFTDEELRPYFSLDRVLDGLFSLCSRLFGIQCERDDAFAPLWNDDVRYYHVLNEAGERIAGFCLDPYSRPQNKRGGAWMDDCVNRCLVDGVVRLPVAHLVCNGTPPAGDTPSLMTFREVETLFHEFGHGLQHMLTTIDERDASGINGVEWDAVELPSQFMENWCYHRPTLLGMAVHYESGAVLPDELFRKICKARTYRAGSQMLRQLQFGMTDMELHSTFDPDEGETVLDVFNRIATRTSPMPPLPENRFLCSFQHIFAGGYAAGYYSYKWAEVLSADAFSAFEEAGLDNEDAIAETGRRFRDTILSQGGSRHPMELYKEFRGREPDTEALLRHCGLK